MPASCKYTLSHKKKTRLQLSLWPLVQQIRHFEARPVRVETRGGSFTVPSPLLLELGLEVVFEHLHDVLAQYGEELVAVEGAAGGDVETLCGGVGGDDEVGGGGEGVPGVFVSFIFIFIFCFERRLDE